MKIFAFRNNRCHLKNITNHPDVTSKSMTGMISILKSDILLEIVLISEAIRKEA